MIEYLISWLDAHSNDVAFQGLILEWASIFTDSCGPEFKTGLGKSNFLGQSGKGRDKYI